jgi:hypothetical protein
VQLIANIEQIIAEISKERAQVLDYGIKIPSEFTSTQRHRERESRLSGRSSFEVPDNTLIC